MHSTYAMRTNCRVMRRPKCSYMLAYTALAALLFLALRAPQPVRQPQGKRSAHSHNSELPSFLSGNMPVHIPIDNHNQQQYGQSDTDKQHAHHVLAIRHTAHKKEKCTGKARHNGKEDS